jgi:hypothetical protein
VGLRTALNGYLLQRSAGLPLELIGSSKTAVIRKPD